MISLPATISVPLRTDNDGAIRVGNTRVLLELVIRAFNRGETPEGIVDSYPSLKLNDLLCLDCRVTFSCLICGGISICRYMLDNLTLA